MPERIKFVYPVLLLAITFLVYHEVGTHDFVWDTVPLVLGNSWILDRTAEDFVAMFTRYHYVNWQPLVWVSHSIDFKLFGMNAGYHHLANVLYHAVDGVLVYIFVQSLLRGEAPGSRQLELIAFIAALVFLIHPQHVQSVAWVVERKDTLYGLFTLLCLLSYLSRWRTLEPKAGKRILPGCLLACALMSKPMAVTVPFTLLLLDLYPLNRWDGSIRSLARLLAEKWLYWVMAFGVALITLNTQSIGMVATEVLPWWARVLTASNNYLFYFYHYLVPLNLSPFYPYETELHILTGPGYWLPGALLLAGGLGLGFLLWRERGLRWPLVSVMFYIATLFPVIGLIQVGSEKALDYYSYLATLPFGVMIAAAIVKAYVRFTRARAVIVGLACGYVLALNLLAFQLVKIWKNEVTLWLAAYQYYPESGYINRNLSGAYLSFGDVERALFHAEQSARTGQEGERYLAELKAALALKDYMLP